jgi:hypothetical protein
MLVMALRLGPAIMALAIGLIAAINAVRAAGGLRQAHAVVAMVAVAGAIWWIWRARRDR